MSWKEEEWKENLPVDALSHITTMESTLNKLKQDVSQLRFMKESLTHTASNLDEKIQAKNTELQERDKEIGILGNKLDEKTIECENLTLQLKKKDDTICMLNEKIKKMSMEEEANSAENENHYESNENHLSPTNAQQVNTIEFLENLLKEKNGKEAQYKEQITELSKEIKVNDHLKEKTAFLEGQVQTLSNALDRQNSDVEFRAPSMSIASIASKAKSSKASFQDSEECNSKIDLGIVESIASFTTCESGSEMDLETKQSAQLVNQNVPMAKSLEHVVSNYLGIDPRTTYSDSQVKTIEVLIEENKRLQQENDLYKSGHVDDKERCKSVVMHAVTSEKSNMDSGDTGETSSKDDEQMRQQHAEMTQELELQKKEVAKLRNENLDMKKVYENHMKVCGSQKSNEALTENMRTKTEMLGNLQLNVQNGFTNLENKYISLESMLAEISAQTNLSSILNKLDEMKNASKESKLKQTDDAEKSEELDQLKSDLMSNFFAVQNEIQKGHEKLKDEIVFTKDVIIDNMIHSTNLKRQESNLCSSRGSSKHSFNNYYEEKRSPIPSTKVHHISSTNSISELETIKEKLGGIQQNISDSMNEKRKNENERKKLQDELVKMVETLKRKDHELGRMTQLYEDEKKKVFDNDAHFRKEMEELKHEQLEIYEEFRNMCEQLKRKDLEAANREKKLKLINAERREKEDELNEKIMTLQTERAQLKDKIEEVQRLYSQKCGECENLLKKFVNATEQSRTTFEKLSKIDAILQTAKANQLYK